MGSKRNKKHWSGETGKRKAHPITNQRRGEQDYDQVERAALHLMSQERKEFGLIAMVGLVAGCRLEEVVDMKVDDVVLENLPFNSLRHIIDPYIQSIPEAQPRSKLFDVSPKEYKLALREAGASCGIPNLRHNDLRRHFIEELARSTKDIILLPPGCDRIMPTRMYLRTFEDDPFSRSTYPELPHRSEE